MYQTLYTGNGVDIFVNGPELHWRLEWVPALAAALKSVFEPATTNGHAVAPLLSEGLLNETAQEHGVLSRGAGKGGGFRVCASKQNREQRGP